MSESRRSAAFANGLHARCPHLIQLRLTNVDLCRCSCHVPCPVSGPDAVILDRWWDACTCPGSDRQRAERRIKWKQDRPPTVAERERRQRAWDDELSQASAAVFSQAKGQPAGVIRQLLIDPVAAS